MAEGRPPYIIHVYSAKHKRKPHANYGKLGKMIIKIYTVKLWNDLNTLAVRARLIYF